MYVHVTFCVRVQKHLSNLSYAFTAKLWFMRLCHFPREWNAFRWTMVTACMDELNVSFCLNQMEDRLLRWPRQRRISQGAGLPFRASCSPTTSLASMRGRQQSRGPLPVGPVSTTRRTDTIFMTSNWLWATVHRLSLEQLYLPVQGVNYNIRWQWNTANLLMMRCGAMDWG